MKKRSVLLLAAGVFLLMGASAVQAQISTEVWHALINQSLTLEKKDGSQVPGKLVSVADKTVVVTTVHGRSVSVPKDQVQSVRISITDELSASDASSGLWQALLHQNLVIEKSDESEVPGRLGSVDQGSLVIVTARGNSVTIPKNEAQTIRLDAAMGPSVGAAVPKEDTRNVPPAADRFSVSTGVGGSVDFLVHPDFQRKYAGDLYEDTYTSFPVDLYAFVDLTFLQISAGYMFVSGGNITSKALGHTNGGSFGERYSYATLAAYLKYPLGAGAVRFFPLLGVQYRLNLTFTDSAGNDLKSGLTAQERADLDELWIRAGVGMDISIGRFFIRPEILAGLKPLSTSDRNTITAYEALGYTDVSVWFLTAGVNLLIGYRF